MALKFFEHGTRRFHRIGRALLFGLHEHGEVGVELPRIVAHLFHRGTDHQRGPLDRGLSRRRKHMGEHRRTRHTVQDLGQIGLHAGTLARR